MEPEVWQWIWLAATVVFTLGELVTPGAFFLAPFAAGAALATVAAFMGIAVAGGWAIFLVVSLAAFAALRPLARRLDQQGGNPTGVGASRLIGARGVVLEAIDAGGAATGLVRVGQETWRAESSTTESLEAGTAVEVVEVRGTRVVVDAAEAQADVGRSSDPS